MARSMGLQKYQASVSSKGLRRLELGRVEAFLRSGLADYVGADARLN